MFSQDISARICKIFPKETTSYFTQFNRQEYNNSLFSYFDLSFPSSVQKSVVKRRSEFLAGRLCAKKCLSQYGHAGDIPIGAYREPVWPHGFQGAISHTSNIAGALITKNPDCMGVGLDIENLMNNETAYSISSQIMSQKELCYSDSYCLDKSTIYTLIFSAKESFFKAAFLQVQKYFDFHAIEVLHIGKDLVKFKVVEELSKVLQPGYEFSVNWQKIDTETLLTYTLL